MTITETEDEWMDEEEAQKNLVKKINQLTLSELKDRVSAIIPSFVITDKHGYSPFIMEAQFRHTYPLSLYEPKSIPNTVFQNCFKLVENNLMHLYALL